jgi:hypothetical protein
MLTLPDGSKLAGAALEYAMRGEMGLKEYRFVQQSADLIEVQLAFFQPPSEAQLQRLKTKTEVALGNRLRVSVHVMDEIARESFKFKNFISKLP